MTTDTTTIKINITNKMPIHIRFWESFMKYKLLYLLLSFAVVWSIVFQYGPMFGLIMAFQDFNIFKGFFGSEFVGFENFVTVFTNPMFMKAVKNTLLYSFVLQFLSFPIPIALSLMFNELRVIIFKRFSLTI